MSRREQPSLERERRSQQAPVQVGDWVLHPDLGVLRADSGEVRLNPKSLQVLLVLMDAGNRGVSRDALLDAVWGSSYPSDAVVSRAIADLRSAFGEKAGEQRYLRTLPKFGYQLVAEIGPVDGPEAVPDQTRQQPSSGVLRATLIAAVSTLAAALLGLFGWNYLQNSSATGAAVAIAAPTTLSSARPLSAEPGLEHQPRFSPLGDWVIYASKQPGRDDWDLFRTSISEGDRLPVAAAMGVHEHGPAYAPDGQRVAYARITNTRCDVVIQHLVLGEPSNITRCTGRFPTVVDWSPDGRLLAYTNAQSDDPAELRRIYAIDIRTGESRALSNAVSASGTDFYPRFSPSGERVAFLRGEPQPDHRTTLWIVDTSSGAEQLVHGPPSQLGGMTWEDEQTLLVAANEFGLWRAFRLHLDSGVRQSLTTPEILHPELQRSSGQLVAAVVHRELELLLIADGLGANQARAQAVAQSTGDDYWGRLSPDGQTLALISTRSGSPELWLSDLQTSTARRLTRFDGAHVRYPNWHPDGTRLLFTVEGQRGERLHQVTLLSGQVQTLGPELVVTAPRWLGDGDRWVADCEIDAVWQLCVGDATDHSPIIAAMYRPQPLGSNSVVAVDDSGELQRIQLSTGKATPLWDGLPGRGRFGWEVRDDHLYYLRQAGASGEAQLVIRQLSSGFETVHFQDALPLADASISVTDSGNQFVVSRYQSYSDDIQVFEFSQDR